MSFGPNRSITCRLVSGRSGEPAHRIDCSDEVSAPSSAGSASTMMNCDGTMNVCVIRSSRTSSRKRRGSNAGIATNVPPHHSAGSIVSHVPFEYSEVVVSARLLSRTPSSIAFDHAQCCRARCVCTMPLGRPVVPDE